VVPTGAGAVQVFRVVPSLRAMRRMVSAAVDGWVGSCRPVGCFTTSATRLRMEEKSGPVAPPGWQMEPATTSAPRVPKPAARSMKR
jgi:hypothetical protein